MKLKFLSKLLISVFLVCGVMFFAGCSDDDGGLDSSLNGTWVANDDGYEMQLKLNNGSWEALSDGVPSSKGTYTTSGSKITITTTHLSDGKNWYSKSEAKNLGIPEEYLDEIFASSTGNYSVSGNTLRIRNEFDGEIYEQIYTKK